MHELILQQRGCSCFVAYNKQQSPNAFGCVVQVIPLLSVLEDIVQRRIRGGVDAAVLPKGVRLVWTSREREEFTLLSESIMAAAWYVVHDT